MGLDPSGSILHSLIRSPSASMDICTSKVILDRDGLGLGHILGSVNSSGPLDPRPKLSNRPLLLDSRSIDAVLHYYP
jgi:hypothetical protein